MTDTSTEAMINGSHIANQVYEALCCASANEYPHDYERAEKDHVLEIHDWSGITCFDHDDLVQVAEGVSGVETWRVDNPQLAENPVKQ